MMATEWQLCYQRAPHTFNTEKVVNAGAGRKEKAMAAWRGICRANPSVSKAEFAHRLSSALAEHKESGQWKVDFVVPQYIQDAIEHVVKALAPIDNSTETKAQ